MGVFKAAIASFIILMGVLMIGVGVFSEMFINFPHDETGVALWTITLLLGCVLGAASIELGIKLLNKEI
jgi:hypothetical protein